MYVDRDINPVESFRDIFQRSLNNKSSSRPPKLELTGLLIPCYQELHGRPFRFKLGTDSNEYLLSMNSNLAQVAKNVAWEEVAVRGYLDLDSNVFEVEKLTLAEAEEPMQMPTNFKDIFEADAYERIINQRGKLEPAVEYLAS